MRVISSALLVIGVAVIAWLIWSAIVLLVTYPGF
jgi:hypothetical protein